MIQKCATGQMPPVELSLIAVATKLVTTAKKSEARKRRPSLTSRRFDLIVSSLVLFSKFVGLMNNQF